MSLPTPWFLVDDQGRSWPLMAGVQRVGRDPGNAVVLADDGVSREHAELVVAGDGVWLRDLDSRNGTWVAGQRVGEAWLDEGARVRLGDALCLRLARTGHAGAAKGAAGESPGWLVEGNRRVRLTPGRLRIGREPGLEWVVDDAEASRVHAELIVHAGRVTLRDLGSRNGVWVDGQAVREQVLLGGERIGIGQSVFHFESAVPAPRKAAPARPEPPRRAPPPQSAPQPTPLVAPQPAAAQPMPSWVAPPAAPPAARWARRLMLGVMVLVLGMAFVKFVDYHERASRLTELAKRGTSAESAEQRRQREYQAAVARAQALVADRDFDQRLAEVSALAEQTAQSIASGEAALRAVAGVVERVRAAPLGSTALQAAGLSGAADLTLSLSRDLSRVQNDLQGMSASASRLRASLQAQRGRSGPPDWNALAIPAGASARHARALSGTLASQRRQLGDGIQTLNQLAALSRRVGLGALAPMLEDGAATLGAVSAQLQQAQSLLERDQPNFAALERAARGP